MMVFASVVALVLMFLGLAMTMPDEVAPAGDPVLATAGAYFATLGLAFLLVVWRLQ